MDVASSDSSTAIIGSGAVSSTVGIIRTASVRTESIFLNAGQALEVAIGILANLTGSFQTVLTELKGENLSESLTALAQAADRISNLGQRQIGSSAHFIHLEAVTDAIAARVSKMIRSMEAIDSLVVNTRIAAAMIRSSEVDFVTFANEIVRIVGMAREVLENLNSELQSLRQRIQAARVGQVSFETRRDEAVRSIPARLNHTVNAIPRQHKRAAKAIASVWERSEKIQQQIRAAILALQTGDIVRQRLDHIEVALNMIGGSQSPAMSGAPLSRDERVQVAPVIYHLQSAQLQDAGDQFDRDIRQIASSLTSLAAEGRTLRTLAGSAYGAADHDDGTFIGELGSAVGEALTLFANFKGAQTDAAAVMASVSGAAEGLCSYLKVVQGLEGNIRIMGLNTTLRCARVGPEGRALGLIAQELRAYGNEFAKEAGALMGEVSDLAQATRSLGSEGADSTQIINAVMETMKDALATLRQVGTTLGATVSALDGESDRVVALLGEASANVAAQNDVAIALRQAAAALQGHAACGDTSAAGLGPRPRGLLDAIERSYTMASERTIHSRILGRSASAAVVAAQPELEDMLF